MLGRVIHERFGKGVVILEDVSQSRLPICRVVFDSDPQTERLILPAYLEPSRAPMPAEAKKVIKRKRAVPKPKTDQVPDALLYEVPDPYKLSEAPERLLEAEE